MLVVPRRTKTQTETLTFDGPAPSPPLARVAPACTSERQLQESRWLAPASLPLQCRPTEGGGRGAAPSILGRTECESECEC